MTSFTQKVAFKRNNTDFCHLHYIYQHWDASGKYYQIRVKTYCFFPISFLNLKPLSPIFLISHQFSLISSSYFHHCIWAKIVQFIDRDILYTELTMPSNPTKLEIRDKTSEDWKNDNCPKSKRLPFCQPN